MIFLIGVDHLAGQRCQPLTGGADIGDGRTGYRQCAARHDLALVIDDGAGQRHVAARQDAARVGGQRLAFADGLRHHVIREVANLSVIDIDVEFADLGLQGFIGSHLCRQRLVVGSLVRLLLGRAGPGLALDRLCRQGNSWLHDLEDLPDPGRRVEVELQGPECAAVIVAIIALRRERRRDRCRNARTLAASVGEVIVGRTETLLRILVGRHQQAPRDVACQPIEVLAARRAQLIADPRQRTVVHLVAAVQSVIDLRLLQDLPNLALEPQILIAQRHRPDAGMPSRLDRGRRIGHGLRLPRGTSIAVQRTANPQILIRIDQRVLAVDQRAHTKIHVAARGDHARHASRHVVDQAARLDGDGVAIDAAHVVDAARGDARERAVDQARIVQLLRDVQRGGAIGDNLGACAVGQALTPDGQVTARRNDAGVVQPRPHAQRQVAVGNQATYMRVATSQRQCQVALRLQPARACQRVGDDRQALARRHGALGIAQLAGAQFGLRLRGHEPCRVVQRGGAQVQRGIRGQLAAGVVDTVGPHRQRTGQHAQRLRGAAHARVAVVQRSGAQIQRGVGLQQAAQVADRAQGRHRKVLGGDDAALIVQGVR
ncbi:hypothetical protein BRI9_3457 [plant metagenome]|uniref:Uncharacterized protein n=1 Tax=plant metagenome TaxID=1297885 RepID=A0A484U8K0_9ZZZZ